MRLRMATIEDFAICKDFYEDFNIDFLYNYSDGIESSNEEVKLFDGWAVGNAGEEVFEQFWDVDTGAAYVFEDDNEEIIGFVGILKFMKFRWKLAKIALETDCQTLEVLTEIVDTLFCEKRIRELDVSTPLLAVQELLKKTGFKSVTFPPNYSYMRTKQR